jgi:hypothetical protein
MESKNYKKEKQPSTPIIPQPFRLVNTFVKKISKKRKTQKNF